VTSAPAGANVLPAAGTPSVPVLGQVVLKTDNDSGAPAAVGTLHGVRRIPGGTVIYFSIGYPSTTQGNTNIIGLWTKSPAFERSGGSVAYGSNMLVDPVGKKVYGGLIPSGNVSVLDGKSNCICSDVHGLESYSSGEAVVRYQVVAPLPESVAFVDVGISGQVIGHVKVEDGAMTPTLDPMKSILVGMGWPKIDPAQVASSVEPAKSVIDLEGTVTTRATPKQISVALASDVLFATDSATLSPKAQAVLGRAAADVKAAGGTGTLKIIGYTDDTGSPAHNLDLSGRRAAAVAAGLKPLLEAGIRLPTSGKGEADPVAPNETPQGRTLNRRVSVVFAPAGGTK
jgi:outer membrane protein OmpA-like peptidoglycan-associated protein